MGVLTFVAVLYLLQVTMRVSKKKGRRKTTSESGQDWTSQSHRGGCGRQTEMAAAGCEIIGGAPATLWVKGQIDRDRFGE